jgi:oligoribonuclease (3'-5' exoribonuclease)
VLVFGDFETTGLDPDHDAPLEFGVIVCADNAELIHARRRYLFRYPPEVVQAMRQACTFDTHEKTGLWDELLDPDAQVSDETTVINPADFDAELCTLSGTFRGAKPELAGFGPHFDQRFLRRWAPDFLGLLSYRLRDVRTLAQECKDRYPTDWGPKPYGNHRALADCEAARAYLRWFRAHVMSPYNLALSFRD